MGGRRIAAIALGLGGVGILTLALAGRTSDGPGQIIAGQSDAAGTTTVLAELDSEAVSAQPTEVDLSSPIAEYGEILPSYDMLMAGTQVILLAKPIQSEAPDNSDAPDTGEEPAEQAGLELVTFEASELLWASQIATQYLDDDLVQGIDRDGALPLITVAMQAGYPASEIADAIAAGNTLLLTLSAIDTPAGFVPTPVSADGIFASTDGDIWTSLTGALGPTAIDHLVNMANGLEQARAETAQLYDRLAQPFEPAEEEMPADSVFALGLADRIWVVVRTDDLPAEVASILVCEHRVPLPLGGACGRSDSRKPGPLTELSPSELPETVLLPVHCDLCVITAFDAKANPILSLPLPEPLLIGTLNFVAAPSQVEIAATAQSNGQAPSNEQAAILAGIRMAAGFAPGESLMIIDCSVSVIETGSPGLTQNELLALAHEHCEIQTLRSIQATEKGTLIALAPESGRVKIVLSLTDTDQRVVIQP